MTWTVFVFGLLLTTLGATAGSALIATSRAELARFASTQLRGGSMPAGAPRGSGAAPDRRLVHDVSRRPAAGGGAGRPARRAAGG